MREDGVLLGYHAEIAPQAMGVGLQAMVSVRLAKHSRALLDGFHRHVLSLPEVLACYHVAGADDFLVHVGVRDSEHLRNFTLAAFTEREEVAHPRQRVGVVCYSYGLAEYLRRELLVGSRGKRPAFVGTFEDLGRSWGVPITGDRQDSRFWEMELPARMAEAALSLDDGARFDAIIIDEAQDFADDWWTPLLNSLRDEQVGGLYAYSDENQRVFARFGRPPVAMVPLLLDHNLRNTRQIGESFVPLAPTSMELRGGDGPEVSFVPARVSEALEVADEQVEALLEEGWRPKDIALITMGARHPVQAERQQTMGFAGYWDDFWSNDDIFYGHVLGFKGMERRAVVLCVNEDGTRDRGRERLYVGLSRATDRLVVVGDLAAIERMGGGAVAQHLGTA